MQTAAPSIASRYGQFAFSSMQLCVAAQYFIVAGHLQVPAMQGIPCEHMLPQEPQLASSLTMSMQAPPQKSWPAGQTESTHAQLELSNCWPGGQAS
jgi:hypothetical protein